MPLAARTLQARQGDAPEATGATVGGSFAPKDCLRPRLWRATLRPHHLYMRDEAHVSFYQQVPGFHLWTLFLDYMHIFHLGVGQDLGASCLCKLAQMGLLDGANVDDSLSLLGLELRAWCTSKGLVTPARPVRVHTKPAGCCSRWAVVRGP